MAVKHCNHLDSTIDWPSNGRNRADGPLSSKQTNKQTNRRRTKPSEPFHDHRCRPTASFEVLVVACIVWHFLEAFEADTQSQRMAVGFQNVKFRLSWRTVGHLLGTRWWWSCSVAASWDVSVSEVEGQVYIFSRIIGSRSCLYDCLWYWVLGDYLYTLYNAYILFVIITVWTL